MATNWLKYRMKVVTNALRLKNMYSLQEKKKGRRILASTMIVILGIGESNEVGWDFFSRSKGVFIY